MLPGGSLETPRPRGPREPLRRGGVPGVDSTGGSGTCAGLVGSLAEVGWILLVHLPGSACHFFWRVGFLRVGFKKGKQKRRPAFCGCLKTDTPGWVS